MSNIILFTQCPAKLRRGVHIIPIRKLLFYLSRETKSVTSCAFSYDAHLHWNHLTYKRKSPV